VILFVATAVVIIVLSLLTAPIPKEELAGLTWATIREKKQARNLKPEVNVTSDDCMWCLVKFIKFRKTKRSGSCAV
jgi:hypothetical protein